MQKGVLPEECIRHDGKGGVVWGGGVAPGLIGVKRKVERERIKDQLRGWVGRWDEERENRKRAGKVVDEPRERKSVKMLVQGFARRTNEGRTGGKREWKRSDRDAEGRGVRQPTRAHVLGLRRFWEGIGRGTVKV